MEVSDTIEQTNYFKLVDKYCPQMDQGHKLILTCSLELLIHVANADKIVAPHEISYIKRFLKNVFELKFDVYRPLTSGFNFIYSKEKENPQINASCKKYLNENLSNKQKISFLNTVLCLSVSDKEISEIEKKFIKNIGLALDLDKNDITESILSKSFELVQEIDAEIAADKDLNTELNELNKINFVSTYEFMKSIQ